MAKFTIVIYVLTGAKNDFAAKKQKLAKCEIINKNDFLQENRQNRTKVRIPASSLKIIL